MDMDSDKLYCPVCEAYLPSKQFKHPMYRNVYTERCHVCHAKRKRFLRGEKEEALRTFINGCICDKIIAINEYGSFTAKRVVCRDEAL